MFWPAAEIKKELADQFILIGEDVLAKVQETEKTIERLYTFNYFLSAHELDLVKKLHSILIGIALRSKPIALPEGAILANPTCSNMAYSLLALQSHYRELSDHVFQLPLNTEEFLKNKVMRQYHQDAFHKCIKTCSILKKQYPKTDTFARSISVLCWLNLGNNNSAFKELPSLLENERTFFGLQSEFVTMAEANDDLKKLLVSSLGQTQYEKFERDVQASTARARNFERRNQQLLETFNL